MIPQPTPSQLQASIEEIWSFIKNARVYEACATSRELLQDIEERVMHGEVTLLHILADACFACGYAISMNSRNRQVHAAIAYFRRMEEIAREIDDPASLVIALTYQGDTCRRRGDLEKARNFLQAAHDASSHGDLAACGNCAQLLGRVYLRLNDLTTFERLMAEAEEIAVGISPTDNSIHGQYCLGTVHIEYARAYGQQGHIQKAMDFLDRAKLVLPPTPHWETLLMATQADILVRSGDVSQGLPLAIKLVEIGNQRGNMRLLERIYDIQYFLTERAVEISKATASLNEALHGQFDL
jgi:tetratricopeptide (TPR) repeat protein